MSCRNIFRMHVHAEHPEPGQVRLQPLQQKTTYDNRAKASRALWKDMPLPDFKYTLPAGLGQGLLGLGASQAATFSTSSPSVAGNQLAVPSEVETASVVDGAPIDAAAVNSDDERAEAELLGLTPPPSKKAKKNEKPVKKDKHEIMDGEVTKTEAELVRIVSEMGQYPEVSKNLGYDIGKLQRSVDKLSKQAREQSMYDSVACLKSINERLSNIRDVHKTTCGYLPAKGKPIKKGRDAFFAAVSKATEADGTLLGSLAVSVRHAFADLSLSTDLQQNRLEKVATLLSATQQKAFSGDDETEADKQSGNMCEKVLNYVLDEMLSEALSSAGSTREAAMEKVKEKFLTVASAIIEGDPVQSVQSALTCLQQIVALDCAGRPTLDDVLSMVQSQREKRIFRVFVNTLAGESFLQMAQARNATLQTQATAVCSLNQLMDDIIKCEAGAGWSGFMMSKTEELAPGMLPELVKLSSFCAKCSELLKAENILEHPACSEALTALLNMLEDVLDAIKKSIQSEVDAITIILSKREDLRRGNH